MNRLSFKIDFQRLFLGYPSVKWTIGSGPGNPPEIKISFDVLSATVAVGLLRAFGCLADW